MTETYCILYNPQCYYNSKEGKCLLAAFCTAKEERGVNEFNEEKTLWSTNGLLFKGGFNDQLA